MPRDRKRKTNIGQHTEGQMRVALRKISEGQKIKTVAKLMNIPYTTLYRYNEKIKKSLNANPIGTERVTPNYTVRKIFTDAQEKDLVEYLTRCSNMFYGLTLIDTRKLAYETAVINNIITVPQKWHDRKLAGLEWMYSFRKRHPVLSLRTPEGCSLSRATSFNRHNVAMFYDNLKRVMARHESFGNGTRVWNLDETNTMTVQKSAKVLAVRGQKQVSKVTSAERGTLVTTCYCVNALGNTLPPVMIFPRVHFKSHMINEAPTGTLGLATPSGWMNGELFVQTMQHFIKYTNSCKDNPCLLILDNHESHVCIEALNLAKDNGVTILTVPPHSTGKMQPLDVGVFGPFKVAYNRAVDNWMMRNPGKTFSIYDVAGCVNEAHLKSMTPNNICNAFKATGIFPYDRDVFTDVDFAPSDVTDRPPNNENEIPENRTEEDRHIQINEDRDRTRTPSPSVLLEFNQEMYTINSSTPPRHANEDLMLLSVGDTQNELLPSSSAELPLCQLACQVIETTSPTTTKSLIKPKESTPSTSKAEPLKPFTSPFEFRGIPKAGARKHGRAERRKGKSMIATDTPNKNEIEQRTKEKNKGKKRKESAKAAKKKILDSDSEEVDAISLYSEEEPTFDEEEDMVIHIDPTKFPPLQTSPKEGNFILVEFKVKDKKFYYIAKVIGHIAGDIEVSFLRKSVKSNNKFHMPNVPDIATITMQDIKMILPQPGFTGSTKRAQGLYCFDIEFTRIDVR